MSRRKILWVNVHWKTDWDILESKTASEYGFDTIPVETLAKVNDDQWRAADAIIATPDIPPEKYALIDKCKIIVTPKVGYDNMSCKTLGKMGIPVCNVPDYGTMEVADHAIGLLLSLTRGILYHSNAVNVDPTGNWRPRVNPYSKRLSSSTLGIVGLGRIGLAVALRAKAFGMDVVFYDPYIAQGMERSVASRRAYSLKELVRQCDFLSLHTPLTEETNKFINEDIFNEAKPGMILVNTSRGDVVDIDALYEAMKNEIVMAAGLDVLPVEPATTEDRLIGAWNRGEAWLKGRLIVTPHVAYLSPGSQMDVRVFPVITIGRYLNDGVLQNCVNAHWIAEYR